LAPGVVPGGWCSRCRKCGPNGECHDSAVKSGRCGDWVWYVWKGHQWRRRWLKPYDPKTPKQVYWRALFAAASKAYSGELTEEQQDACIAAGAKRQTRPRLGQSGPETGHQWWVSKELSENPPARTPKTSHSKRPAG
jgi:hypothetical protein